MRSRWDLLLFLQILAIGAISLLIIFSINKNLATNQFIFWAAGLVVLYFTSHVDYHDLKSIARPFYVVTVASLLALLFFGAPVRGSIRWVDLGIFRIQPSEVAKAAVIILLSTFYTQKSASNLKNNLLSSLAILPPALLIFLQPDIGNTLTLLAIWFGISFASGLKLAPVIVTLAVLAIVAFGLLQMLAPYQRQRVESFLDPTKDPLGTGYNIIQSKIAIGSGQIFGRGFARGSQSQLQFLPEAESDFIFASIAEQLGLFGASLLLALFGWMVMHLVKIMQTKDRFGQLILSGIISFLLLQFLVNVGMNMAILPVTGITFPLVSYGGSSLVVTLFLLGLAFSVIRFNRESS
jgi:rod shape determining protein RodA